MASSDNLEPWLFPWVSDAFARDTDALTKAFTHSICSPTACFPSDESLFDVLNSVVSSPSPIPTPRQSFTASGSGSDPDTASKFIGRRSVPGPVAGKAGKRKARKSKKSPTMFITADADNFRQMVQQVTGGVKFPVTTRFPTSIVRPEAQRISSAGVSGCLPTLDTSAFLLDRHQQALGHRVDDGDQSRSSPAFALPSAGEIGGVSVAGVVDFGSFSCFPTLDSWGVM